MFKYYNANPVNNYVGDCVVRAISTLTGKDWMTTKIEIFIESCLMYRYKHDWNNYSSSKIAELNRTAINGSIRQKHLDKKNI